MFVEVYEPAVAARRGCAEVPAPVRSRVIATLGRLVEANLGGLATLITREVGKPIAESPGEVREVLDTCDYRSGPATGPWPTTPTLWGGVSARRELHTDTLERCAADHGRTRV